MNRLHILGYGATIVVSSAVGAYFGYVAMHNAVSAEFDAKLTAEITATKRHYAMLYKKDEFASPMTPKEDALPIERDAAEAMVHYQGTTKTIDNGFDYQKAGFVATEFDNSVEEDPGAPEVIANVFSQGDKNNEEALARTWAMEVRMRSEEMPYIIRHDEFGEGGNVQIELTWYEGDNTLADDQDNIIEDPDQTIGIYNLKRFGEWSDDPNVVYVRNELRDADFMVARTKASYKVTVAGLMN